MNLFRSEEHAQRWSGYTAGAAAGLLSIQQLMELFSAPVFRNRLSGSYISNLAAHYAATAAEFKRITNDSPFWRRP
jgi:hypothetical protein